MPPYLHMHHSGAEPPPDCDVRKSITSLDGKNVYYLKRPASNRDVPRPRSLADIIGAHTGGTFLSYFFFLSTLSYFSSATLGTIHFLYYYPVHYDTLHKLNSLIATSLWCLCASVFISFCLSSSLYLCLCVSLCV